MLLQAFRPVAWITVVVLVGGSAASFLTDPIAGEGVALLNGAAAALTVALVLSVQRRSLRHHLQLVVGGWSIVLLADLFVVGLLSPTQRGIATALTPYVPLLFALFLPLNLRIQGAHVLAATVSGVLLLALPGSVVPPLLGALTIVVGPCLSLVGCHLLRRHRHETAVQMLMARRWGRASLRQSRLVEDLYREQAASARRDALTGVGNRLAMTEDLDRLTAAPSPTALLLVDLDNFKRFNDEHGHLAGDEALCGTAALLVSSTRPSDRVYRFGGEEFLVVLPGTSAAVAEIVGQRLLLAVERGTFSAGGVAARLTISIGLAVHEPDDDEPFARVLDAADGALYRAKRAGRNRLAVHPPSIAQIGRDARSSRQAAAG